MLGSVSPQKLDAARSDVKFDKHGSKVHLAHVETDEWAIDAWVSEADAIVSTSTAHEHFFPDDAPSTEPGRPWTSVIVDFIAEALRGEIEVRTTRRGNKVVATEHFLITENGDKGSLGRTGLLRPARLMIWRPKQITVERISFS